MSDWSNAPNRAASDGPSESKPNAASAKSQGLGEEPGLGEGIPVEELVRLTREFTARITNEDRQRLAAELNESGHQRSIQSSAPFLLQQFFTGKIDLDVELARRYPSAPLLSSTTFTPEPGKAAKHGFALYASQDNAAAMSIEVHGSAGARAVILLPQTQIPGSVGLGPPNPLSL